MRFGVKCFNPNVLSRPFNSGRGLRTGRSVVRQAQGPEALEGEAPLGLSSGRRLDRWYGVNRSIAPGMKTITAPGRTIIVLTRPQCIFVLPFVNPPLFIPTSGLFRIASIQ